MKHRFLYGVVLRWQPPQLSSVSILAGFKTSPPPPRSYLLNCGALDTPRRHQSIDLLCIRRETLWTLLFFAIIIAVSFVVSSGHMKCCKEIAVFGGGAIVDRYSHSCSIKISTRVQWLIFALAHRKVGWAARTNASEVMSRVRC